MFIGEFWVLWLFIFYYVKSLGFFMSSEKQETFIAIDRKLTSIYIIIC